MTDRPSADPVPVAAPRVLVIEIESDLLGLIEQWLRSAGFEVLAPPGLPADAVIDLVIADLPYPSRAQVDSLRANLAPHGHVPILVLSSTVFASVDCCGSAARALGADGLLPKPTTGDALRRAVGRLIRR